MKNTTTDQPTWVQDLWDRALDGDSEETHYCDRLVYELFQLGPLDDGVTCGDVRSGDWVLLWEDKYGSLHSLVLPPDIKAHFFNIFSIMTGESR